MKTDAEIMKAAKEAAINAAKPLPGLEAVLENNTKLADSYLEDIAGLVQGMASAKTQGRRISPGDVTHIIHKLARFQEILSTCCNQASILRSLREQVNVDYSKMEEYLLKALREDR